MYIAVMDWLLFYVNLLGVTTNFAKKKKEKKKKKKSDRLRLK